MTLNLTMPEHEELKPRITVFGVGGAGGNAVNNMIEKELDGVEFVVANTDAQALQQSKAGTRVQLGVKVTEGLGAGARPTIGAAAAEESIETIIDNLAGSHMCFITAGMGGGTGTGATPIIAQAARELGVLTVGVVTKPFQFEGAKRMRQAEEGIENLQKMVDTLIIIPNQNLFRLANEKTTFTEAFSMADDVLYQGVKGVTDLMVRPGLINLDFADVRAVMDEMGKAMMGTGEGTGEDRAVQAAEKAIANPLLDEISLKGARGVLINITGGYDLTLFELDEAANRIREEVDPDANIIVGSTLDPDMSGEMRVSVVATGIEANKNMLDTPQPRRLVKEAAAAVVDSNDDEVAATEDLAAEAPAARTSSDESNEKERTLFDRLDQDDVAADADDDLPPPAYRGNYSEDRFDPVSVDLDEPEQVARQEEPAPVAQTPQPRAERGQPSRETLERLYRAASKEPNTAARNAQMRPAPQDDTHSDAERPRFGINSLINRMTGHQEERTRATPRMARGESAAGQPAVSRESQHAAQDPEEERVEIPAFLRRQAN